MENRNAEKSVELLDFGKSLKRLLLSIEKFLQLTGHEDKTPLVPAKELDKKSVRLLLEELNLLLQKHSIKSEARFMALESLLAGVSEVESELELLKKSIGAYDFDNAIKILPVIEQHLSL